MIAFRVHGNARPQGSMRAFMRPGARYPVVTHSNPAVLEWRRLIASEAQRHAGQVMVGPVAVELEFALARPARMSKLIPAGHTKRPDLDKLIRAVLDACTGVIWSDDSQVSRVVAVKRYARGDEAPNMRLVAIFDTPEGGTK